ncbi:MAG: PKD domain-containing protein, partial [Cyclobacteriaceae bacterium]|nr:PKD domain-containing protein [Cyclobacteriaceae bacterium]
AVYQYGSPGTYPVRLDVTSSAGCPNQARDTITLYPAPVTPVFSLDSNHLCVGNNASISNVTDDGGYDGKLTYIWNVGDSILTGFSPSISFYTAGVKTISVTSSIPGCESLPATDSLFVHGLPVPDFSGSLECLGTSTQFTNLSTGGQDYQWDFGDGYTSLLKEPSHLYAQSGLYPVSLQATDGYGCSKTISQEIRVASIPIVDFQHSLVCENDTIFFQDLSSATDADIVSWSWQFGDSLQAAGQNPVLALGSDQSVVTVRETVMSSSGCTFTLTRDIQVLQSPVPSFSYEPTCAGEEIVLINTATPGTYTSAMWSMGGVLGTGDTLRMDYPGSGDFPVTLTLTSANLCTESYQEMVHVAQPAVPDFAVVDRCENEFTTFHDLSISPEDPIRSLEWYFDGVYQGEGSMVSKRFLNHGAKTIRLRAATEAGCQYEITRVVDIFPAPEAHVVLSADYGVVGANLAFENTSTGDSLAQWLLDGQYIGSDRQKQYAFPHEGMFDLRLVVQSADGCLDSMSMPILIAYPEVDLRVRSMRTVEVDANYVNLVVELKNNGNLPVENFYFEIELDNGIVLREQMVARVNPNQSNTFHLSTDLPYHKNAVTTLCVAVYTTSYETADLFPVDNEACITLGTVAVIDPPFPNPADQMITIRAVLPYVAPATIELIDLSGRRIINQTIHTGEEGLNTFSLDLQGVERGVYFLRISVAGTAHVSRIVIK